MSTTLTVYDQSTTGNRSGGIELQFPSEHITVRELIRERVYQEVEDYNRRQPEHFRGLVQPTDTEQTLNGFKLRERRQINWRPQYDKALTAFEANQILILVNDHQADSLDDTVELTRGTEVTFLKLTPLVGG